MSEETSPTDVAVPARRRIVPLSERRVALPVAIIAHEGEERDDLESHISRVRPTVTFPSLAHFGADAARTERWAGIVVARTHAWDARLDTSVPRRAFIALFRLTDEGHGWPDAVKRIATPEELDAWLTALAAPVLPADDRQRVMKPRVKRSIFTMSLTGPDPKPARAQLTLPSLGVASKAEAADERSAPGQADDAATESSTLSSSRAVGNVRLTGRVQIAKAGRSHSEAPKKAPSIRPSASGDSSSLDSSALATALVPKGPISRAPAVAPQGLRLTSEDAHEQAVIDAVQALGAGQARAIIDAMERFEHE